MDGARLPLTIVKDLLIDAKAGGIRLARFFGGEPTLHPDLPEMVRFSNSLGLETYITTNGTHLKTKFDALYDAGLRFVTIGFYGVEDKYDRYTQRKGHFQRLDESLTYVSGKYGDEIGIQLNFVLFRTTCNVEDVDEAWQFAMKHGLKFHIDPVSYTLPFFNDGPEDELPFRAGDEDILAPVIERLLHYKKLSPELFWHSSEYIRSLPDWLLKQDEMLVPCDAYNLIWIGADGVVQLCDAAFPLGNLHETRLRDILFKDEHKKACRDGFALNCPKCLCGSETRIQRHFPSVRKYGASHVASA